MAYVVRYEDNGREPPPIVARVLQDLGWVEYDEDISPEEQPPPNLWWKTARFMPSDMTKANAVYQSQRLNHFPKSGSITKKDNLHRNLRRLRVSCGGGPLFDFAPVTFVLPNEYVKFCKSYAELEENEPNPHARTWICKPSDLSRGRKIFVFSHIGQLLYDSASVVQRYVHNPLLLNGRKFDFRIYVLVTSFQPLRAYIYRDCLGRFSTEPYDLSKLDDVFRHLTNYSINREAANFGSNSKLHAAQLTEIFASRGIDFADIFARIDIVVMLTLLSIANDVPENPSCFELFGFDIIFDENFKAWLLEVNFSPALGVESEVDEKVKYPLISDLVRVLNIRHYADGDPTARTLNIQRRKSEYTTHPSAFSEAGAVPSAAAAPKRSSSSTRPGAKAGRDLPGKSTGSSRFVDKPEGKFELIFPFSAVTERDSFNMVAAQTHQEKDRLLKAIVAEVRKKDNALSGKLKSFAKLWKVDT